MSVALKEHLALFRLSYLCHRAPGFRWIGKSIPPTIYFKWQKSMANLAYHLYPADRRRSRYLQRAMRTTFPVATQRRAAKRNILYREWLKVLTHGWPTWAERCQDWARLEGAEHLTEALRQGKGVVLLSGHSYGFTSVVCPILSQLGYRLNRTGRGAFGDPAKRWGREWIHENWQYDSYGQDFWQHLRALHKMQLAIKRNEVIHLLVRGFSQGDPRTKIDFYHEEFFLDPVSFRIVETLQAPVLPCFPLCDDEGRLVINLYPPLPPSTAEIMRAFGPLYSSHLKTLPEFAFFWRKLVGRREGW